jgi:long-chain acyl-CoA synthetase
MSLRSRPPSPPYAIETDGHYRHEPASEGVAAAVPRTSVELLQLAASGSSAEMPAMMVKQGGHWEPVTWRSTFEDAKAMACSLAEIVDFRPFGCVSILGFNSPQWTISSLAAQISGGKAAGVYPSSSTADAEYIASHSESTTFFCSADQFPKLISMEGFKAIIVWDAASTAEVQGPTAEHAIASATSKAKCPVYTYEELLQAGRTHMRSGNAFCQRVEAGMRSVQPEQGAILIYTSGTTGKPKAVQVHPPPHIYTRFSSV